MGMKRMRVFINGYGRVGRLLAGLIAERREELMRRLGLELILCGIGTRHGSLLKEAGSASLIAFAPDELTARPGFHRDLVGTNALLAAEADVVVEATPTNIVTGGPALATIRGALLNGINVVTLTKGPLVVAFAELKQTAQTRGLALKFSGATAAALPTADIAAYSLAGTTVLGFAGVLNGTSNFILNQMAAGADYAVALAEAQARGIAEADPTLDVGGWDTAVKALILANATMDADLSLADAAVTGITGLTPRDIEQAAADGAHLRLVGRAKREDDGRVRLTVAPEALPLSDPLAILTGTNKGITFITDTMGAVTALGGGSDPLAAAAAALKDIINIGLGR